MNWTGRLTVVVSAVLLGCAPSSKLDKAAKDVSEIVDRAVDKGLEPSQKKDLRAVYMSYMNHHDVHNKGPESWDELVKFATDSNDDVEAIGRVRKKGVQITWGIKLSSLTEGAVNTVFAQGGGGPTMMCDGSFR